MPEAVAVTPEETKEKWAYNPHESYRESLGDEAGSPVNDNSSPIKEPSRLESRPTRSRVYSTQIKIDKIPEVVIDYRLSDPDLARYRAEGALRLIQVKVEEKLKLR